MLLRLFPRFLVAFLPIAIACQCKKNSGNDPAYNIATGSLTVSPLDTIAISGFVPLGNLNPPGHTFPTDHMYMYYKNFPTLYNIKSPGNLRIFRLSRDRHGVGLPTETQDFSISFGTSTTELYLAHVQSISQKITDAVNNFNGADCQTYTAGGIQHQQCRLNVAIDVSAGEIIGTGGTAAGQYGLDIGMRVNGTPACPLDYFSNAAKAMLNPKLSNYNGTIKRVDLPLCGEWNLDLAGTAQGNWLRQGTPKYPEDNHIALVKDNIRPTIPCFSVGSAVPGLAAGVYSFNPANSGVIDRQFKDVSANGTIYCYNLRALSGALLAPAKSIILRMENSTTLLLEQKNCDCSCTPYTFTAGKVTYVRE
jgi:hypothetical protein